MFAPTRSLPARRAGRRALRETVRGRGQHPEPVLCVVPDSNQLFGQLTAARPRAAWQQLLRMSKNGQIRLTVPELVQWELANQMREQGEVKLAAQSRATAELRLLGLQPPAFGEGRVALDALLAEASEDMRGQITAHGGEILSLPVVDHSELVRRSLQRRPPFDLHDRGYRDALIWHTVLELVRDGEEVLLISNDGRAFSAEGDTSSLHPALAAEIEASCGDRRRVTLRRDLRTALVYIRESTSAATVVAKRALACEPLVRDLAGRIVSCADEGVLDQSALSAQGWPNLLGVRIYTGDPIGAPALERVISVPGEPLSALVSLRVRADLDVRLPLDLDIDDDLAMVASGDFLDFGVGQLDHLVQLRVSRDVEVLCAVALEPEGSPATRSWRFTDVALRDLRIPRRGPGDPQRRLDPEGRPVG